MNTGIFGEGFPYSNFHDLNMDWIIKIAKDFLDQYTHIQEIIEQGKTDIQDLTTSGLTQLQDKADNLEALLQAWYDEHSADIADQLADALTDLNAWYNEHSEDIADQLTDALADLNAWYNEHSEDIATALSTAVSTFDQHANSKALETIASIPDDYTTLANEVSSLEDNLYEQIDRTEITLLSGKYIATSSPINIENILTNANFVCAVIPCSVGSRFKIYGQSTLPNVRFWSFIKSDGTVISQAGYNDENAYANGKIIEAPMLTEYLVYNSDSADNTYHYPSKIYWYPSVSESIDFLKNNISYFQQGGIGIDVFMGGARLKAVDTSMVYLATSEVNQSYFSIRFKKSQMLKDDTHFKNGGLIIYNKGVPTRVRLRACNRSDWAGSSALAILKAYTKLHTGFNYLPFNSDVEAQRTPNDIIYLCFEMDDTNYGNFYIEYIEDWGIFKEVCEQPTFKDYNIVFLGDSLTAGAGGSGTDYPAICSGILNASYFNGGIGGEPSEVIACRAGGNEIVIPAGAINGTYTNEQLRDYVMGYPCGLLRQGNAGVNPIYINGLPATLSRSGDTFTISDYTGDSSAFAQTAECSGSRITGDLAVIFIGENNPMPRISLWDQVCFLQGPM